MTWIDVLILTCMAVTVLCAAIAYRAAGSAERSAQLAADAAGDARRYAERARDAAGMCERGVAKTRGLHLEKTR